MKNESLAELEQVAHKYAQEVKKQSYIKDMLDAMPESLAISFLEDIGYQPHSGVVITRDFMPLRVSFQLCTEYCVLGWTVRFC